MRTDFYLRKSVQSVFSVFLILSLSLSTESVVPSRFASVCANDGIFLFHKHLFGQIPVADERSYHVSLQTWKRDCIFFGCSEIVVQQSAGDTVYLQVTNGSRCCVYTDTSVVSGDQQAGRFYLFASHFEVHFQREAVVQFQYVCEGRFIGHELVVRRLFQVDGSIGAFPVMQEYILKTLQSVKFQRDFARFLQAQSERYGLGTEVVTCVQRQRTFFR